MIINGRPSGQVPDCVMCSLRESVREKPPTSFSLKTNNRK